jgi:hypothetical protein
VCSWPLLAAYGHFATRRQALQQQLQKKPSDRRDVDRAQVNMTYNFSATQNNEVKGGGKGDRRIFRR